MLDDHAEVLLIERDNLCTVRSAVLKGPDCQAADIPACVVWLRNSSTKASSVA